MKKFKRLLAAVMAMVLCIPSVNALAGEETATAENLGEIMESTYISYEMANTNQGDAAGVIKFHFGNLSQDIVTSILYYWTGADGNNLEGYYHITEFGDGFKSAIGSTKNAIAEAANGFTLQPGTVIPFGAAGLKAVVTVTLEDGSSVEETITECEYITTVNGVQVADSTLPQYKKAVVDYTTDVNDEEMYQMFYLSDFHNYYGWNTTYGETYDTNTYTFISSDAKKGSPQGKALYAVNQILGEDDKTVGIITAGDVVDDSSDGQAKKGYISRGDYNSVLATYYQAGLMKYMNFFANGNHDLVKAYTSEEMNQHVEFLTNAYASNKALADAGNYAEVTGYEDSTNYYYDFYVGNDHYIVLSSPYEEGAYGTEQLTWFEGLISADDAENSEIRTFIISHEPIYNSGIYATSSYMSDDQELKTLIETHSVNHKVVWFSGHTHVSYIDNVTNVVIGTDSNVSYVGLPYVLDTGLHSKRYYEAQGTQVKVYDDKIVMIGRILFDGSSYRTEAMPSAMYVIDNSEENASSATVTVEETGAENNKLPIGSSVTATLSGADGTETYQWYAGGVVIEGATAATYTVDASTPEGRLSVEVTTADGEVYYGISTSRVGAIHIKTAEQLKMIGQDGYPLDGHYVLDCDIDLGGEDWTPIGYYNGSTAFNDLSSGWFTGIFDGNGYTISNITCLVSGGKYQYAGFFGSLNGATVQNVRFENCSFEAYGNGNGANAGIVTGATKSTTTPAPYSTVISNVMVENCTVTTTICNTGNAAASGGLVGYSESGVTIRDCYVNADVVGKLSAGDTAISNRIGVGGLVGAAYDAKVSATDCVIMGTLSAEYYGAQYENPDTTIERKNSVLGFNSRGASDSKFDEANRANVTNCYYSSAMEVNSTNPRGKDATVKTAEELSYLTANDLSLNSEYWYKAEDSVKLKLSPEYSSSVIKIYTANELSQIGDDGYPLNGSYKLMKDIDMSTFDTDDDTENGNWTPIGYYSGSSAPQSSANPFTGTFDGDGYMISNATCTISGGTYVTVGLFGTLKDATVKNVRFANCSFHAVGNGSGAFAGVVAGTTVSSTSSNSKLVEYDTMISNVLVDACSVYSSITTSTNNAGAGGLVGYSQSGVRINNCYVDVDASAELNSTSAIESKQIGVAGLVGNAYAGKVWAVNCIVSGTLNVKNYGEGVTPTPAYQRQNSILGVNSRGNGDVAHDNPGLAKATNCYYDSSMNVNSSNPRGLDGTPLSTTDFGIRSIETLGLDSELWIHTGYAPTLAISGETAWDGTPDVNVDGDINVKDVVRLAKFKADNQAEGVLYRAANLDDDTDVDGDDVSLMRQYLLEHTYVILDKSTASNFKLLGNTVANAQEFYMDFSYTGFSFNAYVEGEVEADFRYMTQNAFPYAKLAVIVDGDYENRTVIEIAADGTYTLANVEAGNHTFEVIKITERTHDILKADKLSFKGYLTEPPADKEVNIQFIGDSITAASALDSYTRGNSTEEQAVQDILQGYAYQTATLLDADFSVRARSGIKTAAAATALLPNMSVEGNTVIVEDDSYDIVVIGLGTNDNGSETLAEDVTTMLTNARIAYPSAKIVWIYGMMIQTDNATIQAAVEAFAENDGNVYYFDDFTANQAGGAGHPNAQAHAAAGEALATYIRENILAE